MLVTISDLHLNDGTVCKQTPQSASKLFFENIKTQAEKARIRTNGKSIPLRKIDIVMNGDIFDIIRSDVWFKNDVRPWGDPFEIQETILEICKNIIARNKDFLNTFKEISKKGIILDGDKAPTKVRIFYLVGNHDWFLCGACKPFEPIRKMVIDAFGLNQDKFSWEIEEDFKIHKTCLEHNVYIRHGDKFDEYNYHEFLGRNASSVGDAIALELVTNFPNLALKMILEKSSAEDVSEEFINALEELDNIRPSTLVPVYINNLIRHMTKKEHKTLVKKAFKQCLKNVQKSWIFKEVSRHSFLTTLKLRILQIISSFTPIQVIRFVSKVISLLPSSYQKAAAAEKYIRNGRCKYVVYGHTHIKDMQGIGKDQIYFNSATWRQIHDEITLKRVEGMPYITYNTMTWVTFYRGDERRGREYEIWDGSLGLKYE